MSRTVLSAGDQGRVTTNHDRIRSWAAVRDADPARTDEAGETALRFSFGDSNPYERIGWDAFFETFERQSLAFVFQRATMHATGRLDTADIAPAAANGDVFYKFVDRDTI